VKPTGGLARRASAVDAARRDAPALLVDAGDALFHAPALDAASEAAATARARLVLSAMGRMRYAALAVGERELALGPGWLAREAAAAGVPLLSLNLALPDGTHPFPGTRVVEVGGERVGLLAAAAAGPYPGGLVASDPVAAVRAAAAALRESGATLVVALLHMPEGEGRALVREVPGVDVAVLAHDARRLDAAPAAATLVTAAGERGRGLGILTLWPDTKGAWGDAGAPRKAEAELASIRRSIDLARRRAERATREEDRRALRELVATQERRAGEAEARTKVKPSGRLYDGRLLPLTPAVGDDPALLAEQQAVLERHGPPPGPPDPDLTGVE
jgi:2',3'-cyclic-nucleotide 2'-phosphodiesterase (5'-nucleotidase family)